MSIKLSTFSEGADDYPEPCFHCRKKTRAWTGTDENAVPCCSVCAVVLSSADVPTRAAWFEKERKLHHARLHPTSHRPPRHVGEAVLRELFKDALFAHVAFEGYRGWLNSKSWRQTAGYDYEVLVDVHPLAPGDPVRQHQGPEWEVVGEAREHLLRERFRAAVGMMYATGSVGCSSPTSVNCWTYGVSVGITRVVAEGAPSFPTHAAERSPQ